MTARLALVLRAFGRVCGLCLLLGHLARGMVVVLPPLLREWGTTTALVCSIPSTRIGQFLSGCSSPHSGVPQFGETGMCSPEPVQDFSCTAFFFFFFFFFFFYIYMNGNTERAQCAFSGYNQSLPWLFTCLLPSYCGRPDCTWFPSRTRSTALAVLLNRFLLVSRSVHSPARPGLDHPREGE